MLRESTVASGKTSMGAVEIIRLSRNEIKREYFIDFSVVSPDERRDDEQEEDEKKSNNHKSNHSKIYIIAR